MTDTVSIDDVRLLEQCVASRFRRGADGTAIVLALEGFRWLLGEESQVSRTALCREWQEWQVFWAQERGELSEESIQI